VLAGGDLAQSAAQQGAIPTYQPPAALAAEMQRESGEWGRIVKQQKISTE